MKKLEGKTAIITGSNQNIGQAIAELFAKEGANVVINGSRKKYKVDAVVEGIKAAGGSAIGIMADVSDPKQVKHMVAETETAFGPVDIAVSNVAVRQKYSFEEITVEDWQNILNTNLNSAFYLDQCVLPKMRKKGWGRIIHISGYDGFFGHIPDRAANVTAKAGMHALAKAIAREYGKYNVTSNTIALGVIHTIRADKQHFTQELVDRAKANIALNDFGQPVDVAETCLYLAGESGRFVTGQAIHVNGGEFMI